jgi:protein TonB
MKTGILIAVILHAAFLLFGGLIFGTHKPAETKKETIVDVDLTADERKEEKKPEEPEEQPEPPIAEAKEPPPDASSVIRDLVRPSDAPALAALDLAALSASMSGLADGDASFGQGMGGFASGGRIGGTGIAGSLADGDDSPFSAGDIDQPPRVANQTPPVYPAELRGKNVSGEVVVIFMVTADGKVTNQKVERSTHSAFERPALDAVRQWRFEPATRDGKKVASRMRVTVKFQRS